MNVIVSNKNKELLSTLDIEVIKSIDGEFSVDEIIGTFSNFFFNRMFLDITAIKDYNNTSNIQRLSMNFDMNKIIFLLDNNLMSDNKYLSTLISMGIYNFGNTKESLMYLYNHPNTYKDVANIHDLDTSDDNSEKKTSFFGNIMGPNTSNRQNEITSINAKVIGFKSATSGAGATTLIYMLKKYLSTKNEYVVAIEVNKNDFGYFNEKNMYSVNQNNLENAISKFSNAKYIFVDLNNYDTELCREVIYLIEPSIIKLNKMIIKDKNIFEKMYGHKIVLNKSLLTEEDIHTFSHESNSTVAYNLPPLNDHLDNSEILENFIKGLEL